jgi:hypothetical protein
MVAFVASGWVWGIVMHMLAISPHLVAESWSYEQYHLSRLLRGLLGSLLRGLWLSHLVRKVVSGI